MEKLKFEVLRYRVGMRENTRGSMNQKFMKSFVYVRRTSEKWHYPM